MHNWKHAWLLRFKQNVISFFFFYICQITPIYFIYQFKREWNRNHGFYFFSVMRTAGTFCFINNHENLLNCFILFMQNIFFFIIVYFLYIWHPYMAKCVIKSKSVIKWFQNIQFMNTWRGRDGNLEVQILCRSGHLVPKIILLTSACAFIWNLTSDIT